MRRLLLTATVLAGLLTSGGDVVAQDEQADAAGIFEPAGTLSYPRMGHTATLLDNERVLVAGFADWVEFWDSDRASFLPLGSLEPTRSHHSATLLPDGRVLIVGGWGETGEHFATTEAWDPATLAFSPAGSLARGRRAHTATLLPDGRVLIIGGFGPTGTLDTAEIWNPADGSFVPAGYLGEGRSSHSATLLSDGRVLVVGGSPGRDPSTGDVLTLATAEVWDSSTASFSPIGSLTEARTWHTATRLPDSSVLIVGGAGDEAYLASAELWDPAENAFHSAGSLADARTSHTATLLMDGRVLIVGGSASPIDPLASAELWQRVGEGQSE